VIGLPPTLPTDQPNEDSEATLLSFYRQLIQRDSTLATERGPNGTNLVHWAAMTSPVWSQHFIESYIDLLVANGADITAVSSDRLTPLHYVAHCGSHRVAASLCRRLAAADISRGLPNASTSTPLTVAAIRLDDDTQQLQDNNTEQAERDRLTIQIPSLQNTIPVLLQAGADIGLMPTATDQHHRRRQQLVLSEYATVLNNLPDDVMAAINGQAIHLKAGAVDGPQAAASPSSYTGVGVGVVKRAGFPLEREEHKRAKRDGQTHQLAANLPNGQQPQNPLAPHPAGGVGVPPQPPRVGGGVGVGVDRQQGSGEGRQDGRAPLPHGWKSLNEEVRVRFPNGTSVASYALFKVIRERRITGGPAAWSRPQCGAWAVRGGQHVGRPFCLSAAVAVHRQPH